MSVEKSRPSALQRLQRMCVRVQVHAQKYGQGLSSARFLWLPLSFGISIVALSASSSRQPDPRRCVWSATLPLPLSLRKTGMWQLSKPSSQVQVHRSTVDLKFEPKDSSRAAVWGGPGDRTLLRTLFSSFLRRRCLFPSHHHAESQPNTSTCAAVPPTKLQASIQTQKIIQESLFFFPVRYPRPYVTM